MTAPDRSLSGLSPLQLALLAKQVRARIGATLRADPIAIIGMGCRLPGGVNDPPAFWQLLREGVDAVCEVPADRWNVAASFDPDPATPGKAATKWGGFLDAVDGFDAAYFGILPREAQRMDPQQRVFLEVAMDALNHAGLPRERLAGSRTGVFIASYHSDYAQLSYNDPEAIDARTLTGTVHSVLANRLSWLLDLRGPSVSIDTACSASLVAIHLACESLRHGESDIALAGGVSLMISDGLMISLSKVGFMAPDGRCKTFDASADGFGRGEGCGVIVLKRLSDAVADGDRVLALIRGSAVNQDGHSTLLAAPNGLAQQALIREALANAQLEPHRIGYIEAHGTGTALGDPIEVEALAATVGAPVPGAGPCLMGAAKANLGHLEAAAGVTGVIKSVLVLQHGAVPPQVHFKTLSPHISLAGTRLDIPKRLTPWPAGDLPRCIGTSGFGVGGTNAHVILEEAPRLDAAPAGAPEGPWLLPLSAQAPAALRALVERWLDFLPQAPESLATLCAAAGERRSHLDHRLAVVGGSVDEIRQRLQDFLSDAPPSGWASGRPPEDGAAKLAFVFGGQGQQWIGMGRELLAREAVFRDTFTDLDRRFRPLVGWSLLDELAAPAERSRLDQTEVAQPLIFAMQVALAAQWAAWGIVPDGVVGHSIGELAALYVSGLLTLDDAVRIVAARGRAMQRATGLGAMAAVGLDEAEARALIRPHADRLSIGAVNSPRGVVLSGDATVLAEVLADLQRRGVPQRALPVNYAFHSAPMAPLADELVTALGAVHATPGHLPLYSTVSGLPLTAAQVDAAYFGENVRAPVRFAAAIDTMLTDGFTAFLEIGAHPVLGASVAECAAQRGTAPVLLASLRRGRPEMESLLVACAGIYASVRTPDWVALQGGPAEVVDLPSYPWQHERHWLRQRPARAHAAALAGVPSLLGRRMPVAGAAVFETQWPDAAPKWLADHRVAGRLLVPGMAMLEAFRTAAVTVLRRPDVDVLDFVVHQPLVLDEDGTTTTWQVVANQAADATVGLTLHWAADDGASPRWLLIASAQARVAEVGAVASAPATGSMPDDTARMEELYATFAALGVAFGPSFRTMRSLQSGNGQAVAWLASPDGPPGETAIHPSVLDGALQACVAAAGGGLPAELLLPLGVTRFRMWRAASSRLCATATWQRGANGSLRADIAWHDAEGNAVAEMSDVAFVPASSAALAAGEADDWLYETDWVPAAEPGVAESLDGAWLLYGDRGTVAASLAQALQDQRQVCRVLDAESAPAEFEAALQSDGWRQGRPLVAVVHLGSVDDPRRNELALSDLDALDRRGPNAALALVQAMLRLAPGAQLSVVTCGAQAAGADALPRPTAAALWGFAGAAAVEHPELGLRLVDLDPDAPSLDAAALAAELRCGPPGPARLALRGIERRVPVLRRRPAVARDSEPLRLTLGSDGTIESLRWTTLTVVEPAAGELRIRVHAAGINFRDVLLALGMYPGAGARPGAECAGFVEAVGPGVEGFAIGDAVFGFAPDSLASHVIVPAAFMARWPRERGSLELAAALPAAFLTAMYGLQRLAGLRRGQRVLIHAAAGGVGMAALQVAQRAGAEVFATAGSSAKRALLRSLGVEHVFDSRTVDFAARIRDVTGGAGVDVVLNSLAGEFIAASVDALAADGTFLELGKRGVWTDEQFRGARPAARYLRYDLGEAASADRTLLQPLLSELLAGLADGSLHPPPLRVYEFAEVAEAFRLMAQARHVGKLVLRAPRTASAAPAPLVHADASYWVTGGLGALGRHTAHWLAGLGARHLVLTSRGAPDALALDAIRECEALGAAVHLLPADCGDPAQLRAVVETIERTLPPLRGVVHAAGTLDDGVLLQQNPVRFRTVLGGKAHGAFALDLLTRHMALDFFVLYAAAGTLLGPAGQAAYAAANAELDALAHSRRASGLPALSVDWGLWTDGGMASAMAAGGQDGWSGRGLGWITPAQGFARLERLLREEAVQVAVLPIDWPRFLSRVPSGIDAAFFAPLAGAGRAPAVSAAAVTVSLSAQWRALPESQRRGAVLAHVTDQARAMLGLSATTLLDVRTPLKEAGLDSLMAVELRNALARSIGAPLPATLLFDHPSLDALASYLVATLGLAATDSAPAGEAASRAEVTRLSEAEAEAQLLAELAGLDGSPR